MNSRLENGSFLPKEEVIASVQEWTEEAKQKPYDEEYGPELGLLDITDTAVSYYTQDECGCQYAEHTIRFAETDTIETIQSIILCDEKVKEYLDIDKTAEFLYNCIDLHSLACVQHVALVWNEGSLRNVKSEVRDKLYEISGEDSYAYKCGIRKNSLTLGETWTDASTIFINVDALVESARESAEITAEDFGCKVQDVFNEEFQRALVSTLCHEFRHALYEINEITPIGEGTPYPRNGGEERNVENYGNEEADRILAGFAAAETLQNPSHLSQKELNGLKKASDIVISMVKRDNPVIKALNQSQHESNFETGKELDCRKQEEYQL